MKQGETRKMAPKDKRAKESWKRRDAARKPVQEAYVAQQDAEGDSLTAAIEQGILEAEEGV